MNKIWRNFTRKAECVRNKVSSDYRHAVFRNTKSGNLYFFKAMFRSVAFEAIAFLSCSGIAHENTHPQ